MMLNWDKRCLTSWQVVQSSLARIDTFFINSNPPSLRHLQAPKKNFRRHLNFCCNNSNKFYFFVGSALANSKKTYTTRCTLSSPTTSTYTQVNEFKSFFFLYKYFYFIHLRFLYGFLLLLPLKIRASSNKKKIRIVTWAVWCHWPRVLSDVYLSHGWYTFEIEAPTKIGWKNTKSCMLFWINKI